MSRTIDEKVVELQFDNRNFERNVATSMGTLNQLQRSFNDVEAFAYRSGFHIQDIWKKMSSFFENQVARKVVNAAESMAKALTITPIMTGFDEYETKINSVQTIMSNTASKGTTMEDVTKTLDELNTYADKTIYNFAEMTRNIGTFTAAGVSLEDSAAAIQGISNLAAASGSTSQQASTAMYQLSQALSSGTVRLMDWNSVVNAGMGGEKFQNALKATAKEHGIAIDDIIKKNGSFRESLQDGWLSADILNETLRKFTVEGAKEYAQSMVDSGKYTKEQADALIKEAQAMEDAATKVKTFSQLWSTMQESVQSGWSQSWEIVVGDFEEAKEFLTKLSDTFGGIIGKMSDARNEVLENWKVMGGRNDLLAIIENLIEGIGSIVKPIKEAFQEIIPPLTAERLYNFTAKLKELSGYLIINNDVADKLKRIFKGVFALFDIGTQIARGLANGVRLIFKNMMPANVGLLELAARLGDAIVAFSEFLREGNRLQNFFTSFGSIVGKVSNWVMRFLLTAVEGVIDFARIDLGFIDGFVNRVKERFAPLGGVFSGLVDGVKWIVEKVKPIVSAIGSFFGKIFSTIGNMFANFFKDASFNSFVDLLNSGLLGGLIITITKFINGLTKVTKAGNTFKEKVFGIFDELKKTIGEFQSVAKAEVLMRIAKAIGLLALSLFLISLIDSDKLAFSLAAIGGLFIMLFTTMSMFTKMSDKLGDGKFGSLQKVTTALVTMSIAVLLLASALKKIASCDPERLTGAMISITILLAALVGTIFLLSKYGGEKMTKGIGGLIKMALAILILVKAIEMLSSMDKNELIKGITALTIMLAEIALFSIVLNKSKSMKTSSKSLLLFASAMLIFAAAIGDMGNLKWEQIGKGLVTMGGALAAVTIALRLMPKNSLALAAGLFVISNAILIMSHALENMGGLSWQEIARGLVALGGSLLILTAGLIAMNKAKLGMAAVIIGAASLVVLAGALRTCSSLSWDEIAKGLVALGGAIAILAVGLLAMNKARMGLLALPIAAVSLVILAGALKLLGSLSWEDIAKGLVVMAGAFIILGVAGAVLGKFTPAILAVSAAILIFGVACVAVGVGMMAFATGLTMLAGSGAAAAKAIASIIMSIVGLIPDIFRALGLGIVALCEVISEGMPAIGKAIKAIVTTIIDVLIECIPQIADGIFQLISQLLQVLIECGPQIVASLFEFIFVLLDGLIEYTPQLVGKLFDFLIAILDGVAEKTPELIQAVVNIFKAVLEGAIAALESIDPEVLKNGLIAILGLTGLMAALSLLAPLLPGAMIGVIGLGVFIAELAIVLSALGALAQLPGLTWLVTEGGNLLEAVGTAIGQFIGGIVGGFAQGVTSSLPAIATDLSNFMTNIKPFIEGAKLIDASTLEGVKSLVGIIAALSATSILESIASWISGESSMTQFAQQLIPFGEAIVQFSGIVAGNVNEEAVTAAANAGKIMADMAKTLPNSGGVVGFFAGENDMDDFAAQLVPFGRAITEFSSIVAGNIDEGAVTAAANAGKTMASMADTIPNSGGVVGFFAGENDIDTFGAKLVPFGKAMAQFSKEVSGKINEEAVTAASNAGKTMSEMANTIPNTGGLVTFFTGDNDMVTFGAQIVLFGKAMTKFSKEVSGKIDEGAVTAAANAGKALAEMNNALPKTGGIKSWFSGDKDMSDFSDGIVEFAKAIKKYSKELGGINISAITGATGALKDLTNLARNMSGINFESFGSFGEALGRIGKTGVDKFIEAFKGAEDKVKKAGNNMITNLRQGVEQYKSKITAAFDKLASDSVADIRNSYQSFYDAGSYLVTGFCNGISENDYKAAAKAKAMAKAAKQAAEEALDINSPSKVFYKIGSFTGEGFVNALDDYGSASYKAGSNIANFARSGLNDAISKIGSILESDIDTQPTIRPVLDLSDIKTGAKALDGMLDMGTSVGVSANIGAITTMMNRRNQNGGNDEVVSAIDKLNKNLGKVGNTTYQIDGVTYNGDSDVEEALKVIVRAATVERRV